MGQSFLTLSEDAIRILKPYFPHYSICVDDTMTNSFKVTVTPAESRNMNEANKNTCMVICGDGSFRLQGKPSVMNRVCRSFRDAIYSVAASNSWGSFTSKLIPVQREL